MAEEPKDKSGRLEKWREKRRTRAARRRRVAADKVTHATRGNKDDAMRWGGPMGG
jgi:hypothetical protein